MTLLVVARAEQALGRGALAEQATAKAKAGWDGAAVTSITLAAI